MWVLNGTDTETRLSSKTSIGFLDTRILTPILGLGPQKIQDLTETGSLARLCFVVLQKQDKKWEGNLKLKFKLKIKKN